MAGRADRYEISFRITAEDALEAAWSQISTWRSWWALAVGALTVAGVAAAVLIDSTTASGPLAAAVLLLLLPVIYPVIARPLTRKRMGSLIGQQGRAIIDATGVRLENPLGTTQIPWSSLTEVREHRSVVLLMRDGLIVAYLPVEAFGPPGQRAEIVAFGRDRIASAHLAQVRSAGRTGGPGG